MVKYLSQVGWKIRASCGTMFCLLKSSHLRTARTLNPEKYQIDWKCTLLWESNPPHRCLVLPRDELRSGNPYISSLYHPEGHERKNKTNKRSDETELVTWTSFRLLAWVEYKKTWLSKKRSTDWDRLPPFLMAIPSLLLTEFLVYWLETWKGYHWIEGRRTFRIG